MEFLPPREFEQRVAAALRTRVAELTGQGVSYAEAWAQARRDHSPSHFEIDPTTGWIRLPDIDGAPPDDARPSDAIDIDADNNADWLRSGQSASKDRD